MYFSSRDGRVPVESSIVNQITEVSDDGARGKMSLARGPVLIKVMNLLVKIILYYHGARAKSHSTKYMC